MCNFQSTIPSCIHSFSNNIYNRVCCTISCRRNVIVFHFQNFIRRNHFQIIICSIYTIDENLHRPTTNLFNFVTYHIYREIFNSSQKITRMSCILNLLFCKCIYLLINIICFMRAFNNYFLQTMRGLFNGKIVDDFISDRRHTQTNVFRNTIIANS